MGKMEAHIVRAVDDNLDRLHAQIAAEREAHSQFENWVRKLEQTFTMHHAPTTEDIAKSVVVIGGLGDKTVEDAEALLHDK